MSLSSEDRLAIMDLCARYYVSTDEADVDAFMDCWVDGEVLFESPFGSFRTRQELRAFEDEHVNRGMAIGKRHLLNNVVIKPGKSDDSALVTTYMTVIEVNDIPHIVATGIYRDSLVVRTPSGWKFKHRKLDIDPGFAKLMQQATPAAA